MSRTVTPGAGDALLLVDLQRDFLPGGSLAVAQGEYILPAVCRAVSLFEALRLPIFASRDWHPPDHCSFVTQGGPWPVHCVADSVGAQFAEGLPHSALIGIVSKATERGTEAYSAFDRTDLEERARRAGVRRFFVAGLATDYCVLHTVIDAVRLGFTVVLLRDAVAAVDLEPGDGERALARMLALGADCLDSASQLTAPGAGAHPAPPGPAGQATASSSALASARIACENTTS